LTLLLSNRRFVVIVVLFRVFFLICFGVLLLLVVQLFLGLLLVAIPVTERGRFSAVTAATIDQLSMASTTALSFLQRRRRFALHSAVGRFTRNRRPNLLVIPKESIIENQVAIILQKRNKPIKLSGLIFHSFRSKSNQ
jgi:hypothetical protein